MGDAQSAPDDRFRESADRTFARYVDLYRRLVLRLPPGDAHADLIDALRVRPGPD